MFALLDLEMCEVEESDLLKGSDSFIQYNSATWARVDRLALPDDEAKVEEVLSLEARHLHFHTLLQLHGFNNESTSI